MNNNRITTTGKLVYDPNRGADFRKTNKSRTLIVQLPDDDLDLYYQWFVERHIRSLAYMPEKTHTLPLYGEHETWQRPYHKAGDRVPLQRPMFGTHVTIVSGSEHIKNQAAWKKHDGEIVTFEYGPSVRNHWNFWSIPVYSEYFQELRFELGLKREPDFHITIGRQYEWQPIARNARRRAWEIRLEEEGVLA